MNKVIKIENKNKFTQRGKWVEKPRRCEILICICGGKYLKTRPGQINCLKCVFDLDEKKLRKNK